MNDQYIPASQPSLIRLPDVLARTGLSKSHIYRLTKKGAFPLPRKVGDRAVVWLVSEIEAWEASLPVAA